MKEQILFDLTQIAAALGITERAARKRAAKGRKRNHEPAWIIHSTVKQRGPDKRLYAWETLPADVQNALDKWKKSQRSTASNAVLAEMTRQADLEHQQEMAAAGQRLAAQAENIAQRKMKERVDRILSGRKQFSALPQDDPRRLRAKGREWIITGIYQLAREEGLNKTRARAELVRRINDGTVILPIKYQHIIPHTLGRKTLSVDTVRGWQSDYERGGIGSLIPGWGTRKGCTKIAQNPDLYRFVIGAMIRWPQITSKAIKQTLQAEHPEIDIVSARRIGDFCKRWKEDNAHLWTFITNPDRWKSVYMAGAGSAFENITHPNHLWELDSTPGDWLLTDGRHSVIGCIDLYSRRVKLFVSKTSTAAAVKQVLRRALLDWGVPDVVRTDNGKDYISDEMTSFLTDMQIHQEVCIPFASEEKGVIERFFRTMSHGILNLLDGFIGHSVADRKAIESRKSFAERIMKKDEIVEINMSAEALQAKLNEWVEYYYEDSEHSGLNGKTPKQKWNEWASPLLTIDDAQGLDELLNAIPGSRVIGKKGIRYNNRYYIDRDGVMFRHVGESVTLSQDEHDMGRLSVKLDGKFLCIAEDPDISGISRREYSKAIKHKQRAFMVEKAAELKEYTREIKRNPVESIIDYRKSQSENVIDLPRKSVPYITPALTEASRAADEKYQRSPACDQSPTEEQKARQAALEAMMSQPSEVASIHNKPADRYARAWTLEQRANLSNTDRQWLESYQKSPEYSSQKKFHEEFDLTPQWREIKK